VQLWRCQRIDHLTGETRHLYTSDPAVERLAASKERHYKDNDAHVKGPIDDYIKIARTQLPAGDRKIIDQYHKLRAALPLDSPELVPQYKQVQKVLAQVAKSQLDAAIKAHVDPAYSGWFGGVPIARITRLPHKDHEKIRVIHSNKELLWPHFKYTLSGEDVDAWLAEPGAINSWVSLPQLVCGFVGRAPMKDQDQIPLLRAIQWTTEDTIFTTSIAEYQEALERGYSPMGECGFVFPLPKPAEQKR
jgi:hypothetical protein